MAINLNHSVYGAQFKAFADFAAGQRDQGTIVRLEGQGQGLPGPNGEPRAIVAKQGDGYGHIWRNDDSKAVNDNVRALFLSSVLAVCGVDRVEQLPANVRAVLKDNDYGGGHPLTARRITAVKSAIDANFQAEANAAQSRISMRLFIEMHDVSQASCDQKARWLVGLAKGDVDLLNLLSVGENGPSLGIMSEDRYHFRNAADVERNVEGLRRNIEELRTATGGDRALFERFFKHLRRFDGTPVPAGQITAMVSAVRNLDLTQVRDCLNKDSYEGSFEAFCRLQKMVDAIVAEAGVQGDENVEAAQYDFCQFYKFIYGAIFDDFDAGDRQRLFRHMMTNQFETDCAAARKIAKNLWSKDGDGEQLKTRIRNFAHSLTYCASHICRQVLRDTFEEYTAVNALNLKAKSKAPDVRQMYAKLSDIVREGEVDDVPEVIENPVVDEAPGEDVDDDAVAIEQHEPPAFIDGLEPMTKDNFMMLFYDEAVSRTVAGGRTKEDCDATIKAMFDTIGDDEDDRKFLAELLANGKPAFLAERGRLPSEDDAVAFAQGVKAVLEQAKLCRANFPERYGSVVADTILATLKTMERMVRADELEPIDAELCAKLYDAAAEVDTSDILTLPGRSRPLIKAMGEKLENFLRQVDEKFEAAFPGGNGSPFMRTLKKNIYMNLALLNVVPKAYPLFKVIDEYGLRLRNGDAMENLIDVILPVLKRSTIGRRLIDM